jgi:hypothetical protein
VCQAQHFAWWVFVFVGQQKWGFQRGCDGPLPSSWGSNPPRETCVEGDRGGPLRGLWCRHAHLREQISSERPVDLPGVERGAPRNYDLSQVSWRVCRGNIVHFLALSSYIDAILFC